MERKAIFDELNEIFKDIFDDESIMIDEETIAADIEGWDSLVHVHLVVAIEKKFGIKLTMSEISLMKNLGAMVDIIDSKTTK